MDKTTCFELMATVKEINELPTGKEAMLHLTSELCRRLADDVSAAVEWDAEQEGWYGELGTFMGWGKSDDDGNGGL